MSAEKENRNRLSIGPDCANSEESLSAPQSRSNSYKTRRRRSMKKEKGRSSITRGNSVSLPDCTQTNLNSEHGVSDAEKECSLCTVRSFRTTSKGIVDSGSFSKATSFNSLLSSGSLASSSPSNNSLDSNGNSRSPSQDRSGSNTGSSDSLEDTPSICVTPSYYRTMVLGAPGVGKTSLVQTLTGSDSQRDERDYLSCDNGPIVSIQLDGEESTMEFIDGANVSDLECYRADAYVVMYSVSEPESFPAALSLLTYLRHELDTDRTIFLVANKTDLVRQMLVSSQEAMQFAQCNGCHFIETSNALNVNLDELLVGLLCRIKCQLIPVNINDRVTSLKPLKTKSSNNRRPSASNRTLTVIGNFFKQACRRDSSRRRSCSTSGITMETSKTKCLAN